MLEVAPEDGTVAAAREVDIRHRDNRQLRGYRQPFSQRADQELGTRRWRFVVRHQTGAAAQREQHRGDDDV